MHLKLKEGLWVKLIGDPHLGKKFINGVPLNRRGERELYQMEFFHKELKDITHPEGGIVKSVIVMGDLFDQFVVSNEVLYETYKKLCDVADGYPDIDYSILMGNHDVSRNTSLVSSFDLLSSMFENSICENVHFISQIEEVHWRDEPEGVLMCPYEAFTPTKDLKFEGSHQLLAAFGHWDTQSFGDEHNLLPYEALSKRTSLIVTGHEHNPREFMYDGKTRVIVTGSMLPYSHAEDSNGNIYVTKTLQEFLSSADDYTFKCLRLLLKPGEVVPENINALQVTYKFVNEQEEEEIQVEMEDFSMKNVFDTVMRENEVPEETSKKYWDKYQERDSDATSA